MASLDNTVDYPMTNVGFGDVWALAWRCKIRVITSIVIFAALGLLTLHATESKYMARMVVGFHQFRYGAADKEFLDLGYIQVPDGYLTMFLYQQLFTSTLLAERIEKKYHFYEQFCANGGCRSNRTADGIRGLLCHLDKIFPIKVCVAGSNTENLAIILRKRLRITPLLPSPYFALSIVHPNPEIAQRLLNSVYREVGELALELASARNRAQIRRLEAILAGAVSAKTRLEIADRLLDANKAQVQFDSHIEYVITLVEGPTISSKAVVPDPVVMIPLFLIAGIFLVFVLCVLILLNRDGLSRSTSN